MFRLCFISRYTDKVDSRLARSNDARLFLNQYYSIYSKHYSLNLLPSVNSLAKVSLEIVGIFPSVELSVSRKSILLSTQYKFASFFTKIYSLVYVHSFLLRKYKLFLSSSRNITNPFPPIFQNRLSKWNHRSNIFFSFLSISQTILPKAPIDRSIKLVNHCRPTFAPVLSRSRAISPS